MIPEGSTIVPEPVQAVDMPPKKPFRRATIWDDRVHHAADYRSRVSAGRLEREGAGPLAGPLAVRRGRGSSFGVAAGAFFFSTSAENPAQKFFKPHSGHLFS